LFAVETKGGPVRPTVREPRSPQTSQEVDLGITRAKEVSFGAERPIATSSSDGQAEAREGRLRASPSALQEDLLFVYLSGSIKKGNKDGRGDESFWSEDDERRISAGVGIRVEMLNPAKSKIRRSDYYANFGCDLYLVSISDAVLVDARTRKGIGVGAEMMFARFEGIPVITICPPNSNYRRDFLPDVFGEDLSDWIHPFVAGLSDYIVNDIDEGVHLLNELWSSGALERRQSSDVYKAIAYYNRKREALERGSA
jgi:hypothetical protein